MGKSARIYLAILALPFVLAGLASAALIVWDPLDLRPWSDASPDLDARNYSLAIRPIVAPAQLKSGHEIVLAGTSTTLRVDDELLATLGGGGSAVNVSQAGQTATDGRVLFLAAVNSPKVKRLVLEIGEVWRRPYLGRSPFGQRTVEALAPEWWQLPEFDLEILGAIISDARGGTFYHPQWNAEGALLVPNANAALASWQLASMEQARLSFDNSTVTHAANDASCDGHGLLVSTLDDVFSVANEHGIRVDIIFPAMPYASYPTFWQMIGDPNGHRELMQMQRCVVERVALENTERFAVHAIHTNSRIVGDTEGMIDPFHFASPAKMGLMIEDIRSGDRIMTPENFASHEETLRDGILSAAQRPLTPQPLP